MIDISNISGLVKSTQHHFSYNVSKAAAVSLCHLLASENAANGRKIRVNIIEPGVFPLEMTADKSDDFQKGHLPKDKYESKAPARRPGKDVDMAQAVLFFAVNEDLNNQVSVVDGR